MSNYRFYLLDRHDRIARTADACCKDDVHALERAQPFAVRYVVEVWQGSRLVSRSA